MAVKEADEEESLVTLAGEVFMIDSRVLRGGKVLVTFAISDGLDSIGVKIFAKPKEGEKLLEALKDGKQYLVEGVLKWTALKKNWLFLPMPSTAYQIPSRKRPCDRKKNRAPLSYQYVGFRWDYQCWKTC